MSLTAQEINRFKSMESIDILIQTASKLDMYARMFQGRYPAEYMEDAFEAADKLREIVWDVRNSGLVIKK